MYEIQVTTTETRSAGKRYQSAVTIKTADNEMEKQLNEILQEGYYIHTYVNPLFWLLNFSPMYVYISQYPSEMAANMQLLKLNEEIYFSFTRKAHYKYFNSVIQKVLVKFIEKKLAESKEERLTFPLKKLISE